MTQKGLHDMNDTDEELGRCSSSAPNRHQPVQQRNYNTISTLNVLKELISRDRHGGNEETRWFREHFIDRSSRSSTGSGGRRLSQCPEEDESGEDVECGISGPGPGGGSTRGGNIVGPGNIFERRHLDKRFVDTSLIEMKSHASSTSTLDYDSNDDVWVKRAVETTPTSQRKKQRDVSSLGVVPQGAVVQDSKAMASSSDSKNRSELWVNQTGQILSRLEQEQRRSGGRPRGHYRGPDHQVYHTVTGAVSQTNKPYTPSIFEVFRPRSKSDAATKKPTLMSSVKNAMQNSLKSQSSTGEGSGEHSRGPVAKVIHLFRHRSQSAASAEEKRKARAAALHQQQVAAHTAYLKGVLRRSSLEKRRLSLGTTGTGSSHRGSEPSLDPNHAAILFRDSRGLPVADPFLEKVSMSDLEEDESQIYVKFFKFHRCYGLIPTSAKLVVFDTQLLVKKAFFALVYNGVRAAPLWDSNQHTFVGMLTITDFIKILQMYYTTGSMTMDQMEEHKLDTWRTVLKGQVRDLLSIGPDASLYDAIKTLIHNHIHRLPVIDPETDNVLYILTHKRILRFLFLYINDLPRPSFLSKSLAELRIGTFENVETATEDTTIIAALDKFLERRVSALPIVDEEGRLVDIFAKFDVINLAAEKTYDKLDVSLKQANEHRNEWFEGVHKCSMDDTLYSIIEKIVRAEVHRLVVTDDEDKVIGVLSLSDLLQFLVLRPCGEDIVSRPVTPELSVGLSELSTLGAGSEETILEGEEDESSSREASPPPTHRLARESTTWREVTVSGGE
ncbi:SNF4/AMP-activated protein kinase gamma subunit isoform X3 [Rhodnius prolixus]|uniref:SNF4/AMP-activated protein kinase gamma subunit isoform X3 n=1 Tax=Rhodnius prolixus TaxID=13249 RepID=UPI003D18932B